VPAVLGARSLATPWAARNLQIVHTMCGIAGIVDLKNRPIEHATLHRMCDALQHRGPDAEGYHWNGHAGLGQRRLSIIDLAGGAQPMSNEDGTVWVTFNGEIYNFQVLREELTLLGHRFATDSDTEVIIHAYEEYGYGCCEHLDGMFAFAIWDQRNQVLFLARDRVGKKPLVFTETGGQFIFASELQALVRHPAVKRQLDPTSIDDYLTYGYVAAPKTIYRNVFKLPPACYLVLKVAPSGDGSRDVQIQRYWHLKYSPKAKLGEKDAIDGLQAALTQAVRLRMIADVPLGALLSGGVDSSLIVALMSQLSTRPIKTFSIGFDDAGFNELPYARMVADRYKTDHHELIVRPNALEILPTLIRHYGEPYADSSAIPSYYVAKLTREHVTVALNGDGGDECLGGYDRYLGVALLKTYQRLPAFLRAGLIEPMLSMVGDGKNSPRGRLRQAKRLVQSAKMSVPSCYLRWLTFFTPEQKKNLYSPEFAHDLNGHDSEKWFHSLYSEVDHGEQLDTLLASDVQSYLPNDLLVKMDIASMANSLETRSPFLDHHVMEYCAVLPSHYKRRGTTLKYLLKKLGDALLPRQVMYRRKMGFGVPMGKWLKHELRQEVEDSLLSPESRTRPYFDQGEIHRIMASHCEGSGDHSFRLWALYWLEMWMREFGDAL
jgi:asparagine synthase (glutamine-hydrolysing)